MSTVNTMEGVKSVKRYYNIKCKLDDKDINKVEEVNKFFEQFKEDYINADSKKEFFRVNNIKDNDSAIYNLKLILDLFNWGEISVETINKIAKINKKKAENILKTLCRRIEDYKLIKG